MKKPRKVPIDSILIVAGNMIMASTFIYAMGYILGFWPATNILKLK